MVLPARIKASLFERPAAAANAAAQAVHAAAAATRNKHRAEAVREAERRRRDFLLEVEDDAATILARQRKEAAEIIAATEAAAATVKPPPRLVAETLFCVTGPAPAYDVHATIRTVSASNLSATIRASPWWHIHSTSRFQHSNDLKLVIHYLCFAAWNKG